MRSTLSAASETAPMKGKMRAKREVAGSYLSSCETTIAATLIPVTAQTYQILKH
jgi:hypothetical protein